MLESCCIYFFPEHIWMYTNEFLCEAFDKSFILDTLNQSYLLVQSNGKENCFR
jgi:hypothetical protein